MIISPDEIKLRISRSSLEKNGFFSLCPIAKLNRSDSDTILTQRKHYVIYCQLA